MNWLEKLTQRETVQDSDEVGGLRGTSAGAESRWTFTAIKTWIRGWVTKSDVGLGNVTNHAQVQRTEMGAANGVATLGSDGKVTPAQLPSASSVNWGGIGGAIGDQSDLQAALNAKAASSHTHIISNVAGLQSALDAKAATSHTHTLSEVSDAGTAAGLNAPSSGDAAAGEVVKGDDTRLSNSRTPTGGAGGVLSGSYPNPGFAVDMATQAELNALSSIVDAKADSGDARFPTSGQKDALAGTTGTPGAGNRYVTETDGRVNRFIDVVASHNASGCITTTTGSITNGSNVLSVASAATFRQGQGILVKGAGAGGAHLITSIALVMGTTLTLAANASTSVAAVVVQHDDTAAINAAIAEAFAANGGIVYLTKKGTDDGSGVYRCNGERNATTNSIITFPQTANTSPYGANMVIKLEGECRGYMNSTFGGVEEGTAIDTTDAIAGSGSYPSIIAVGNPVGEWNHVFLYVDHLLIVAKANPSLSGIMGRKGLGLFVGDNVHVVACMTSSNPVEPSNGAFGVHFPDRMNAAWNLIGASYIFGFGAGVGLTEHMRLQQTLVQYCISAYEIIGGGHKITGSFAAESCRYGISAQAVPDGFLSPVDIMFQIEDNPAAGAPLGAAWAENEVALWDPNNRLRGEVRIQHIGGSAGNNSRCYPSVNGAKFVKIVDMQATTGDETVVGDWRFDNNLNDSSFFAYHLTGRNSPTFSAGKVGTHAVTFNGTNQSADVAWLYPNFALPKMTIEGWFKLEELPGAGNLMTLCSRSSGSDGWTLGVNEDGELTFYFKSKSQFRSLSASGTISADTWYKAVVTIDAFAGILRIRLNDGAWASFDSKTDSDDRRKWRLYNAVDERLVFGANTYGSPASYLNGHLDHWKIHARVLTDEEIDTAYEKESV